MTKRIWGLRTVVGAVTAVTLSGAAACSDGFGADDCHANRTCGASGATAGAASGQGNDVNDGGPTANAGDSSGGSSANLAGSPNVDVSAGAAGAPAAGCLTAADCSNGDPTDGEETCDARGVCQPGNPPPTVIAISPADAATSADPETNIVITFSEPLAPDTVTSDNIKVFDGDTELDGTLAYADGKVTFTPAVPLFMLEAYKVSVAVAVTDADGAALASPYSATFTTRDGAWTTIDVASGSLTSMSDALPISANGNVLLAWTVLAGNGCPTTAEWFRLAADSGGVKAFDPSDQQCVVMTSGGNLAGLGAVTWSVPEPIIGQVAQQFRAGAWQAKSAVVSNSTLLYSPRLGVSPTGALTFFAQGSGESTAWRTDVNGKWVAKGDPLSADPASSLTSVAFDANGDGLAVWAATGATTEILYSRYTTTSGKWAPAKAIPDTLGSHAGVTDHPPALAMTPDGDALVVWAQTLLDANHDHIASAFFSHANGWQADAVAVTPNGLDIALEAPAISYDGTAFVAAWVAQPETAGPGVCDNANCIYTSSYNVQTATWGAVAARQTKAADVAAAKMPRLASDGRGQTLLVWSKPAGANAYTLVYQRLAAGKWSAIQNLPGGSVISQTFVTNPLTLAMNPSGMAAVAWGNHTTDILIGTLRLASFF